MRQLSSSSSSAPNANSNAFSVDAEASGLIQLGAIRARFTAQDTLGNFNVNVVRVGFNYRYGDQPRVAARY
jgi:hypothetical protein